MGHSFGVMYSTQFMCLEGSSIGLPQHPSWSPQYHEYANILSFAPHRGQSSLDRNLAAMRLQELYRKRQQEKEWEEVTMKQLPQPVMKMTYKGHRNSRTMVSTSAPHFSPGIWEGKQRHFWHVLLCLSSIDQGSHLLGEQLHHEWFWLWAHFCVGPLHWQTGESAGGRQARSELPTATSLWPQWVMLSLQVLKPDLFGFALVFETDSALSVLATSGIDYDVKLWMPSSPDSSFDEPKAKEVN